MKFFVFKFKTWWIIVIQYSWSWSPGQFSWKFSLLSGRYNDISITKCNTLALDSLLEGLLDAELLNSMFSFRARIVIIRLIICKKFV